MDREHLPFTWPQRKTMVGVHAVTTVLLNQEQSLTDTLYTTTIISHSKVEDVTTFSAIDLIKAHTSITINPENILKTAITKPNGPFEFPFMRFGLRNAGNIFQRIMKYSQASTSVSRTLMTFFYSQDPEQHQHLISTPF